MEKVTIKNIALGSVSIVIPDLRINRVIRQGGSIQLGKDTFEEALQYPGVQELFTEKDLVLLNEQDRLDLGLQSEPGEIKAEDEANVDEIKKIIEFGTPLQLKNLLEDATESRKSVIAQVAADCENISLVKIDAITKATGIDLLSTIKAKKTLAE